TVTGTKAFDGTGTFQATLPVAAVTLNIVTVSAAPMISLPFRLTTPVLPPAPTATTIGSPFGSTTIRERFATVTPALVVSQGPMAEPSSLAPMMNDRPVVPRSVVVAVQGLSWVGPENAVDPKFPPMSQSVVLSAPSAAALPM